VTRPGATPVAQAQAVADSLPRFHRIVGDDEMTTVRPRVPARAVPAAFGPADLPSASPPMPSAAIGPIEGLTPAPPVGTSRKAKRKPIGSRAGSAQARLLGAILIVAGVVVIALTQGQAEATGWFSLKGAFLGPLIFSVGLWYAIEGPALPDHPRDFSLRELSLMGWAFYLVGLIAGALYVNYLRSGDPFAPPW
jgi:hypothetical protein